jgi:hypothetical protein
LYGHRHLESVFGGIKTRIEERKKRRRHTAVEMKINEADALPQQVRQIYENRHVKTGM